MNGMPPSDPAALSRRPPQPSAELQRLGVHLGFDITQQAAESPVPARAPSIEAVVPGELVETPCGPCFVSETRYHVDHVHGTYPLSALAPGERPSSYLVHLAGDKRLAGLDLRSSIFFDIETTGLGIGAGMYAFLVGFGTFEGDEFCLRQYFMRDYGEEEGLLYLLSQHMRRFEGWVSFNGRNFDLPVLQSRFICGRQEMPLAQAPHLDLLYPARRLWRKRLTSCRLCSLEAGVLGVTRDSDVPGWLIPELYFDYVRYGAVEPLRQVFLHNALDVLSLVVLTARANSLLREPFHGEAEHAADLYSLGLIYESCGHLDGAQRAFEGALLGTPPRSASASRVLGGVGGVGGADGVGTPRRSDGAGTPRRSDGADTSSGFSGEQHLPPGLQEEALRRLSALYKRTGQVEQAARIWQILREHDHPDAFLELARYHERHLHDYRTAAILVGQALALDNLPPRGECSSEALRRRLARLRKRLGKGGLPMPHIESYSFGKITVDGTVHTSDVIILPGGVRPRWWRKEGHNLRKEDLLDVIEAQPTVLVIGTGNVGMMQVPQETLDYLAAQGIRVEVEPTAAACQRYNELAKSEQAAAALHITC
jgi:uncharacterized protein YprB with RNaseH-like and TPR domain